MQVIGGILFVEEQGASKVLCWDEKNKKNTDSVEVIVQRPVSSEFLFDEVEAEVGSPKKI